MAYSFTNKMSFVERIRNIVYTGWTRLYYRYRHLPRAQKVVDKWTRGASVADMDRNFSLVLLGNNHVFGYPKPLLPNVIEVHSLQITEKREALPKVTNVWCRTLPLRQRRTFPGSLVSLRRTPNLGDEPRSRFRNAQGRI